VLKLPVENYSLKQNLPQAVSFHAGFVQVSRMLVPIGKDALAEEGSMMAHIRFDIQVQPSGQHSVVYA
jgi:hypothetical protein